MAEKQTAQQKAQAALDLVDRKLAKAGARKNKAREAYEAAHAEVDSLTAERDYLAQHPALKSLEDAVAEAGEQPVEPEQDENLPGF